MLLVCLLPTRHTIALVCGTHDTLHFFGAAAVAHHQCCFTSERVAVKSVFHTLARRAHLPPPFDARLLLTAGSKLSKNGQPTGDDADVLTNHKTRGSVVVLFIHSFAHSFTPGAWQLFRFVFSRSISGCMWSRVRNMLRSKRCQGICFFEM